MGNIEKYERKTKTRSYSRLCVLAVSAGFVFDIQEGFTSSSEVSEKGRR